MADLRVATYNVRTDVRTDGSGRWAFRKEAVHRLLARIDPDLVGLQELRRYQLRYLRERLRDLLLVGRDRGGAERHPEHVPVGFARERFALAELSVRWLSETPTAPGSVGWDAAFPRIVTRARLHDRRTGGHVALLSTHLDHAGERARRESAALLRSMVDAHDPEVPVVVLGDCNCTPRSEPHEAMVAERPQGRALFDARDLAAECVGPERTFHGFGGAKEGGRIDHVFVTESFDVERHQVRTDTREGGGYPSDHLPVVVDLSY